MYPSGSAHPLALVRSITRQSSLAIMVYYIVNRGDKRSGSKGTKSLCSTNVKSSLWGCLIFRGSVSAEYEGSVDRGSSAFSTESRGSTTYCMIVNKLGLLKKIFCNVPEGSGSWKYNMHFPVDKVTRKRKYLFKHFTNYFGLFCYENYYTILAWYYSKFAS